MAFPERFLGFFKRYCQQQCFIYFQKFRTHIIILKMQDKNQVWVYQSNKPLGGSSAQISKDIESFLSSWNSHGKNVEGSYELKEDHFLIVKSNALESEVSGCSKDTLVGLVRQLEQKYGLDFFNRELVYYIGEDEKILSCKLSSLNELLSAKKISGQTKIFNPLIKNEAELQRYWLVPLKDSWHSRFVDL